METERICPSCHKTLPPDQPLGLCAECLMRAGLHSTAPSASAGPWASAGPRASDFLPPPVEQIARLFPQLEILEFIGKGGMGAVYKARQPSLDRLVALKILPPAAASDPGFAERFNREARALARLNHPNIVTVHDFGQVSGEGVLTGGAQATPASLHYLLMEFVDGGNLRQIEDTRRLTPEQVMGGLYFYLLKKIRGERPRTETAFAGFRRSLVQLFLAGFVTQVLTVLGFICLLLPGIYLFVAWFFALPLVIDKRLEFWPAMRLSRKAISKHWWGFLGFLVVLALLNLAGLIACVVGLFVTLPISFAALMYAYEDMINPDLLSTAPGAKSEPSLETTLQSAPARDSQERLKSIMPSPNALWSCECLGGPGAVLDERSRPRNRPTRSRSTLQRIVAHRVPLVNQIVLLRTASRLTGGRKMNVDMSRPLRPGVLHADVTLQSLLESPGLGDIDWHPGSVLGWFGIDIVGWHRLELSVERVDLVGILGS